MKYRLETDMPLNFEQRLIENENKHYLELYKRVREVYAEFS